MLFRREMIAVPSIVTIRFELNPVSTLTNALIIAYNEQGWLDGADQTLRAFMENLSPEKRAIHNLVYGFFSSAIPHVGSMSFPDFLKDFATRDATQLRDYAIHWFPQVEGFPGFEVILNNRETFVEFVGQLAAIKGFERDDDEARRGYEYLIDPVRLKDMMLSHMTFVWNAVLQKEWRKHETSLRQCVEAHQQHNYSTFHTSFEAVEAVTGRDMRNSEKMKPVLEHYQSLVFVPSPYLGPYLSWDEDPSKTSKELIVEFGVRMPQGTQKSSVFPKRAELLIWMTALADDTRLQMLEMLLEEGEICAQDFIDRLQLSQSSASRHLRQLVMAGLVTARRQDVAKCYTLNQQRMGELVHILQRFSDKTSS